MSTYPIDIEPEQIVRWLLAEQKSTPLLFGFDARRAVAVHRIPPLPNYRLGDEEREDIHEVATLATLEVTPARRSDGWTLKITVEDETGPRMSAPEAAPAPEQEIDVRTFYHQFIQPSRGVATATAEVRDAAAERHLHRLLDSIRVDRHPAATPAEWSLQA
ncbi:MAG: hypothetical protein ACM3OF_05260 [Gemmatimonas sp.]